MSLQKFAVLFLSLLLTVSSASAQYYDEFYWQDGATGEWTDETKWEWEREESEDRYPQYGSDIGIITSGTVQYAGNPFTDFATGYGAYPPNIGFTLKGGTFELGGANQRIIIGITEPIPEIWGYYQTINQEGGFVNNHGMASNTGDGWDNSSIYWGIGNGRSIYYNQSGGEIDIQGGMTYGMASGYATFTQTGGVFNIDTGTEALILGSTMPNGMDYYRRNAGSSSWHIEGTGETNIQGNLFLGKGSDGDYVDENDRWAKGSLFVSGGGKVTISPNASNQNQFALLGYGGYGTIQMGQGGEVMFEDSGQPQSGDIYVGYSSDTESGHGFLFMSDGKVTATNICLAQGDGEKVIGDILTNGGELIVRESLYVGTETGNANSTSEIKNLGATISVGQDMLFGSVYNDPITGIVGGSAARPHRVKGKLTLENGNLLVAGEVAAYAENIATVVVEGSKSKINVGSYNTGTHDIATGYILDRGGVSTIRADGILVRTDYTLDMPEAYDFMSEKYMTMGFLALNTDTLDLVSAGTLTDSGTHTMTNNTPYHFDETIATENGQTILRYTVIPEYSLNLGNEITFSDEGLETGSLRVSGSETELLARFVNVDDSITATLLNFLNKNNWKTGTEFYEANGDIYLRGYLGPDGYANFGWDLAGFNDANGSSVRIQGFGTEQDTSTPEPATWIMLLAGSAAVLYFRKKQRGVCV